MIMLLLLSPFTPLCYAVLVYVDLQSRRAISTDQRVAGVALASLLGEPGDHPIISDR